jgi:capsular polysaccharide biosynthesis protein
VQSGLTQWQKELLQLFGYGEDRCIEAEEDTKLECRELHVPSLVGAGYFAAPGSIEHLRRTLREKIPPTTHGRGRLYLSRNAAGTRRLANEEQIEPLLARHGFVTIDPSLHGVAELLSLLQSAQAVIGVEGAPMAHLFFAPPRAKIGMIVAEGLQSTRYYGPSAVLGQDFTLLLARPDFASHTIHEECDLVLDPGLLERFLTAL